jgi:tetratricopeptide (TPR) repeat protein
MDPDPDASPQVAFCRRGRRSLADCYESSARSAFRCSITFAKFLLNPSTSRIRKPSHPKPGWRRLRTKLPSASIDHCHPGLPEPTQSSLDLSELFARAEALEENASHKAEAMYRQILVEDPAYAHAYLNLGYMLCEAGRCESAVELYEDGVRFCPDDPLMHFNRAVAHEGTGDVEGAMHSYEDALRLQPDLLDAHRNAALLYADAGQKQMAIRHFNAYRRLRPGNQTGR